MDAFNAAKRIEPPQDAGVKGCQIAGKSTVRLRAVSTPADSSSALQGNADITDAVVADHRVFHFTDARNWPRKCSLQGMTK
jgi:hypothetical protein